MNYLTFEYFLAIVHTGSIKGAASLLHISQQALSEQVKRLEAELEVNLLTNTRPVQLTPCGTYFSGFCEQMLQQRDALKRSLKNMISRKPEVRISVSGSGYPDYLADVISRFIQDYPDCRIALQQRPELLTEVDLASYDFNISEEILDSSLISIPFPRYAASVRNTDIPHDTMALLASRSCLESVWKESYEENCRLAADIRDLNLFSGLPFIQSGEDPKSADGSMLFPRFNLPGKPVVTTCDAELAVRMCCLGTGAVILPYYWILQNRDFRSCRDSMELFPLNIPAPGSVLYIGYDKNKKLCEEEQAFLHLMQMQTLQDLPAS